MAIRKFVSKELPIAPNNYIGQFGDLWLSDSGTGLHVGDNVTPGGLPPSNELGINGLRATLDTLGNFTVPGNVVVNGGTVLSGTSLSTGEDSISPYWYATINGSTLPKAQVTAADFPVDGPPVVTLTGIQPPADSTRVQIQGATVNGGSSSNLDDTWYTKSTGTPNEYQLWDNYDLDSYTDLSGEGTYDQNSASIVYYGFYATNHSVVHDSNGNIIAGGYVQTNDFNQGVVTKYNTTGSIIWQKTLQDDLNLDVEGIAIDSANNVYVAANDDSKIRLFKLNGTDGSVIWQTGITSPTGEYSYACEICSDGNLAVAGNIVNPDDSSQDFLVAKVNSADGLLIWSKRLGYEYDQEAWSLACDNHGHIVVAGDTEIDSDYNRITVIMLDTNGNVLLEKTIRGYDNDYDIYGVDVAIDSNDNMYIAASGNVPDEGGTAAFIIKMNSGGSIEWTRMIGPGACVTVGLSLALDGDDTLYVLSMNGQQTYNIQQFDFVLASYDSDGAVLWQRYWGSSQAWEAADDNKPGGGQLLSVHGEFLAVGGWQWFLDGPEGIPVGNGAAFAAQLPKDGSLVSIGQWTTRTSNFTGQFISLETGNIEFAVVDNPLVQSDNPATVNAAVLVTTLTSDWPTVKQSWDLNTNGSIDMPGAINLINNAWAEDIWIGPEVYFLKTNYGDEIDYIDTDMQITRSYQNGIYNPALQDGWETGAPEGTEWNSDGWSDLSNVTTRAYATWQEIVRYHGFTDREFVMHDTVNNKYYTMYFLSWQGQGYGGGFSYVRRQINTAAYFTKTSGGSEVDYIDVGLSITRGNNNIIYNPAAGEASADTEVSPLWTLWNDDGWSNLYNLQGRQWLSFYNILSGENIGKRVLGREFIMWDTNNNEYYAIEFTSWQPGNVGGAFSYIRRKIDKSRLTAGITFADGTQQTTAYNEKSVGVLQQNVLATDDDRYLNINDIGKQVYVTQIGTSIYIPDAKDQPWVIGATITIINRSGGSIYLYKDNDNENGTIYGAGTTDSNSSWEIPDTGGGNICTLICIEMYGYDDPTVNWILTGPGIVPA